MSYYEGPDLGWGPTQKFDPTMGSPAPLDDECLTCGEDNARQAAGDPPTGAQGECPGSKRDCGHHCNCLWTQDACCWCSAHVNDDGEVVEPDGTVRRPDPDMAALGTTSLSRTVDEDELRDVLGDDA